MVSAHTQTIVISGYYGFRNSGDEAVLLSILTALKEEGDRAGVLIEPIVLSIDPELTSATYGVASVHRMKLKEVRKAIKKSSGLISGGGSLLQDATGPASIPYYTGVIKLAQWMGIPVFIYAQGVGPVNRRVFYPLIKSAFTKSKYVSVRDTESAELIQHIGVPSTSIEVVPDPVMGMTLPTLDTEVEPTDGQLPTVGISVRYWNPERTELTQLAKGLKELCQQMPVHIRFLPFHLPGDEEASRFVIERIGNVESYGSKVSIAQETPHPQHMLLEVSKCQLLIGMRLHSLIYAASQNVPLLGISYDPKIDHFLARLGADPIGTSQHLDPDKLLAGASALLQHGDTWRASNEERIQQLREDSRKPARHIIEYLRNEG